MYGGEVINVDDSLHQKEAKSFLSFGVDSVCQAVDAAHAKGVGA